MGAVSLAPAFSNRFRRLETGWLGDTTWHGYRDALNVTQWSSLPRME